MLRFLIMAIELDQADRMELVTHAGLKKDDR